MMRVKHLGLKARRLERVCVCESYLIIIIIGREDGRQRCIWVGLLARRAGYTIRSRPAVYYHDLT